MKGRPGATFYHQIYYADREDEVAYCAYCDAELLTSDNEDEASLFLCTDCVDLVYPDKVKWKKATRDSDNNPPTWVHDYSAYYIIRQGSGDWENVKYRTQISGSLEEIGHLQKVLREMPDRSAAILIKSIVTHDSRSQEVDP